MAITFNPDTGLVADEGSAVRQNVADTWKAAFKTSDTSPELNTEPETPAGQLIDGITALIIEKDNEFLYLGNMFNPATAVGVFQDALGQVYFLNRHVAQPTTVVCTCNGLQGTQIPAGAIVEDVNGNQFISTQPAQIPTGSSSVDVTFQCIETGPIVVNASTVNKIITVIPGWDSVNNTNAGIVGRNRETQAEFEQRRYDSVAKNSHGLAESISSSIGNLEDVVACRIEQNRTGETVTTLGVQIPAHSVYLSVYGGNQQEIGAVFYSKIDAGCGTAGNTSVQVTDSVNGSINTLYYTVPTLQNLYVQITVDANSIYTPEIIQQAVINNFSGGVDGISRVIMGDTVYASRFYQTVITAGLDSLIQIQVSRTSGSGWATSVSFNLNEMPALSEENITFVEG